MVNMAEDCQFLKELNAGNKMALYNLAVCKGQVKLFSKGIKPTQKWRLKDVKNYFGLSGGTDKILTQLTQLQTIIKDINLNDERDSNA